MALAKKALQGLGKVSKALTEPNTIADGGLSAAIIRRRFKPSTAIGIVGGMGAVSLANEGLQGRNKATLGRVRYNGGPARMTGSYTSGAVRAMHRASGGNYGAFSDMAEEAMQGQTVSGAIETYGATPELISALYHMGGR